MAFDPSSATLVEDPPVRGFDPSTAVPVEPSAKFDPSTAVEVPPDKSPTPETNQALQYVADLVPPESAYDPSKYPQAERAATAVTGYVKGMIPGDIKGALRMMNLPTDFTSPEQLVSFAYPMLSPAIQTLETIKSRAQQIQEAEKTPAGSQERWNAGIGTVLDLAQLAGLLKGGEALARGDTARPEGVPATPTPPEAQTQPIGPTVAQERPSGEPLRSTDEKFNPQTMKWEPKTDRDYWFDGTELYQSVTAALHRLGVKASETDLPQPDQFTSGKDFYYAMYNAEGKMRASGAKVAGFAFGEQLRKENLQAKAGGETADAQQISQASEANGGSMVRPADTGALPRAESTSVVPPPLEGFSTGLTDAKSLLASRAKGVGVGEPETASSSLYGGIGLPKPLADLFESQPIGEKTTQYADVKRIWGMVPSVVRSLENPQVFQSVIKTVPVDMVNMLATKELPAQRLLNDPAMFVRALSEPANRPVAERLTSFLYAIHNPNSISALNYAINNIKTTTLYGRLRSRSELPLMPPEESSQGVQPSGQGEGVAQPAQEAPQDVAVTQPEGGGSPATAAVSGAETPPAAEPPSVTSIKNATVDAERASRGLPPAMSAIERDFPEVRDQLLKKLDQDPVYQDNLIEELKAKPRALTDLEDAALLHRQVDLQNQFEKTANNLIIANEAGDLGAVDELNIRAANLSDKLLELYDVGKASGTETGRGLNARKMLANEDFSLASMITQKRAVVKGRQLTPEQVAEVGRAHKDITAKQIAYDAYETSPKAEAYRKRLRNLAAEYRERTAKGDFAPRPRKQIPLDPEAMKLKADVERARIDFKRGLAKDRLQNRTWWEKALDGIAKWRRTFILSWPTVLGKLTTASGELIGITPAEEFIRKGVTKVLPEKVTSKSLRYGEGSSLRTEVGAVVHTWKELFKAVPQRFKTGNADIDLLYGRPDIVPSELKDYVSNLHSALKEPARQNEFFRAQQQILQRYAERGVDISDPIIQTKAGFEAYRHANSQIFVEDNRLANAINAFIGRLGDINKLTRKPSGIGKVAQTAARYEFPIVRIPLNIIKRTFEYSAGVPLGTARLVRGMIEGLDGMAAPEADAIIRNISRGALGATAIAYGYFHPEQFGGYYQRGEKRAPDDLKPGHARVLGRDLPPWAVHNPLLAQFQIGSSIRRIVDSKLRKRDVSGPSYRQAIVATYGGVIEDAPLVRQTEDSLKALDIRQQNQFLGEHLKSGIPGAVEWTAQQLDKDANGNPVVRKPEDILDYVKMGIPGLRQQVPEKEGRTRIGPFR